jgi:hypothetical protein
MPAQTMTSEYLVICRGAKFDESLSPEDTQNAIKTILRLVRTNERAGKVEKRASACT